MNPVLILTHNLLPLTQRTVASLLDQAVSVEINIIDNGSSDGTAEWAARANYLLYASPSNAGVSRGWNFGLNAIFRKADHVLVLGNDTVLPPWFYQTLLSVDKPFVTGVAVNDMRQAWQKPDVTPLTPNPDFSAFLIRQEAWEKVGPFDQRMVHYCSDCDYHVRAHRLGLPLLQASIPFYHERSSTMRLAPAKEQAVIARQAESDRAVFRSIYNCVPGDSEYEKLFI